MFAHVYHLFWSVCRYVMAVCLFGQRTIFILLATTQVKYGEIFYPVLPSLIVRSNVFCPSLPPFHIFWGSTRTFWKQGQVILLMFHYTDNWRNVHYPLLGGSTSDTSANNIQKPTSHPTYSFICRNDCKWMSLWPKWSEGHGEGDLEGERESIKK